MSKFTKHILRILAQAASEQRTITYGGIIALLRAEGRPLHSQGIGRQLFAVHKLLLAQQEAQGIIVPPLTAIAVAADGEPGNGLSPVLAEWLAVTNAMPAMVRDAEQAAAAGAAPPPHVLRFAQHQAQVFDGWRDFLAAIPDEAYEAARAGHHSKIGEAC